MYQQDVRIFQENRNHTSYLSNYTIRKGIMLAKEPNQSSPSCRYSVIIQGNTPKTKTDRTHGKNTQSAKDVTQLTETGSISIKCEAWLKKKCVRTNCESKCALADFLAWHHRHSAEQTTLPDICGNLRVTRLCHAWDVWVWLHSPNPDERQVCRKPLNQTLFLRLIALQRLSRYPRWS